MHLKKFAAEATLAGAVGFAALGAGTGLAHADPFWPTPPPPPIPAPGPGANVGWPGNPLPPGQHYQPPPGHADDVVPVWAPPAPPPPPWAPWTQVVWNAEVQGWGVWWNGGFTPL
jgi:hypothetical protein